MSRRRTFVFIDGSSFYFKLKELSPKKRVDVRLAVETIRFARLDKYDNAYLPSSDTNLIESVEEVQSFVKFVQSVGTPKGQSFGLSKTTDDVRLLGPEEIENI